MRPRLWELGWLLFAGANFLAMVRWESWETIPFHFIWVSLTLLYGFRVWGPVPTLLVLGAVVGSTGVAIFVDARHGTQEWGELFEVPLMSLMFLAMVWHARRRQQAMGEVEQLAESRASLLERQERFLHDVSHELRTPVTIARGHLEIVEDRVPEVEVALDELGRIERIVEGLLLLARAERPDFLVAEELELEPFLEDVFMRWSEVAPRRWLLGPLAPVRVEADPERLRIALDALLENAVKYTEIGDTIEISSRLAGGKRVIEVRDEGCGIPADAISRIFDRFARADASRSRGAGGAGLGLAIVDAIAKAHGGACRVRSGPRGTIVSLELPSRSWASVLSARDSASLQSLPVALAADPEAAPAAP
ncbi:MAG: sensor histidine kinase [Gaiellaceae bacterium]